MISRRGAMALCLCWPLCQAGATDVPRIIDDDGPARGIRQLSLSELWRVGGENEDVLFGRIADLKLGADGNLYVLDNQLCRVVVISTAGEHVRDISREGDGPGELRQPIGLVFLADSIHRWEVRIPRSPEMHEGTCYLVGKGRMVVVRGTESAYDAGQDDGRTEIEPLEIICYKVL